MTTVRPSIPAVLASMTMLLSAIEVHAGSPPDSSRSARLEVRADVDSAIVRLDSSVVGRTPLVLTAVAPGRHVLTVSPPRPEEWSVTSATDTIDLLPEGSRSHAYRLRFAIPLRSDPPGAEVSLNDSLVGLTPLLLRPDAIRPDTRLTLRMKGYDETTVPPASIAGESALTIALRAGWQADPDRPSPLVMEGPSWNLRRTGMVVSGSVAVLAGVGAAYFKIAADNRQEAFLAGGDPALATERRHLDTLAGISLAVAEAGILVLSYLLITE